MQFLYIILVVALGLWFFVVNLRSSNDHIFSPFPGYSFLFSLYFLAGTLSLDQPAPEYQWLAYILALCGFSTLANPIVFRFMREALVSNNSNSALITDDTVADNYFYQSFNGVILAVIWIVSLFITAALWAQNGIPLLSGNVDAARMQVVANGYLGTLSTSLDVAALFSIIFIFSSRGRRKDWRFWLAILVILSFVLVAGLSGSRSRIFKFLIPAIVALHFTRRRINLSLVLLGLPIGVLIIGLLGYFRAFSRWNTYVFQGIPPDIGTDIFSLIIYYASIELRTAVEGLSIVMEIFPSTAPFTLGWLHMGPLVTPFQLKIPIPGNYFKELIGGTWDGVGLAATFIAPMYAEYGMIGIFGFSALYGLILGVLYRRVGVDGQLRYYRVGTYALMFYFMISAIRSDFVSFDVIWFMLLSFAFRVGRIRLRRQSNPKLASGADL